MKTLKELTKSNANIIRHLKCKHLKDLLRDWPRIYIKKLLKDKEHTNIKLSFNQVRSTVKATKIQKHLGHVT